MTEKNWGAEPWRAPALKDGETLIYDECGRVFDHVDYRSHWFRLVKGEFGGWWIRVKHGGGEEEFMIDHGGSSPERNRIVAALRPLDSDTRYYILHKIFNVYKDAILGAAKVTAEKYGRAFAEGRLKKRKARGRGEVKVWIEPKIVTQDTPPTLR